MKNFYNKHLAVIIWIIITILYIMMLFNNEDTFANTPLSSFVGLFVPSAIWITLSTYGTSLFISALVMMIIDSNIKNYSSGFWLGKTINKYVLIFISLFILTMLFDWILYQDLRSLDLFLYNIGLSNKAPNFTCCNS